MRRADRISSIVLIIVATIVCLGSLKIGLGTFHAPGSGFLPFFTAVFLGLISLLILIKATLRKKSEEASPSGPVNLRRVIQIFTGLCMYILLLPSLGYIVATFLFMLFLFKGIDAMKWRWAAVAAILIDLVTYLAFDVWLQSMLPVGVVDIRELMRWIY